MGEGPTSGLEFYDENIPCLAACPVNTNAGMYVAAIADGNDELAYLTARLPNPFASVCGRVCAAPCEGACRRGQIDRPIAIRALKRYVTEQFGPEQHDPDDGAPLWAKVTAPPVSDLGKRIAISETEAMIRLARFGLDNVIGYVADYEVELPTQYDVCSATERMSIAELIERGDHSAPADGAQLLDVRNPGETDDGIIPGAIVIPMAAVKARGADELDAEQAVIVYCGSGMRSSVVAS
jgi:hypothetical protein